MIEITHILAVIGLGYIIVHFIIPMCECLLFATGYLILILKSAIWSKAIRQPWALTKYIFRTFRDGIFRWAEPGDIVDIQAGKYKWTPYFNYEKIKE